MSASITSINAQTPPAATATATSNQTLTQADFLQIMVAQFTQQDPLASGSDGSGGSSTSDYVTQLMSMTNLTTLQTMSGQQAQQLADSLPGATVEVQANGVDSSGVVQSSRVDSSNLGVYFTVNGTEYPSADLYAIQQTAAQTAAAAGASTTSAMTPTSTTTPTTTTGTTPAATTVN
jgi:flagellar hook assembly protein FlgD